MNYFKCTLECHIFISLALYKGPTTMIFVCIRDSDYTREWAAFIRGEVIKSQTLVMGTVTNILDTFCFRKRGP